MLSFTEKKSTEEVSTEEVSTEAVSTEAVSNVRQNVKQLLHAKKYDEIYEIFSADYGKELDESFRENFYLLYEIFFIVKNKLTVESHSFKYIINLLTITKIETKKQSAYNDIIEFLFETLFVHKSYEKILQFTLKFIEYIEQLNSLEFDGADVNFISKLYTLRGQAFGKLKNPFEAKDLITKGLAYIALQNKTTPSILPPYEEKLIESYSFEELQSIHDKNLPKLKNTKIIYMGILIILKYLNLAYYHKKNNEHVLAEEYFTEAIKRSSQHYPNMNYICLLFRALNNLQQNTIDSIENAIKDFSKAFSDPLYLKQVDEFLNCNLKLNHLIDSIISSFQKVLKNLLSLEKYHEVIKYNKTFFDFINSIKFSANSLKNTQLSMAHRISFMVYFNQAKYPEALKAIDLAIANDRNDAENYCCRAYLYYYQNEINSARADAAKCKALPNDSLIKERITNLSTLLDLMPKNKNKLEMINNKKTNRDKESAAIHILNLNKNEKFAPLTENQKEKKLSVITTFSILQSHNSYKLHVKLNEDNKKSDNNTNKDAENSLEYVTSKEENTPLKHVKNKTTENPIKYVTNEEAETPLKHVKNHKKFPKHSNNIKDGDNKNKVMGRNNSHVKKSKKKSNLVKNSPKMLSPEFKQYIENKKINRQNKFEKNKLKIAKSQKNALHEQVVLFSKNIVYDLIDKAVTHSETKARKEQTILYTTNIVSRLIDKAVEKSETDSKEKTVSYAKNPMLDLVNKAVKKYETIRQEQTLVFAKNIVIGLIDKAVSISETHKFKKMLQHQEDMLTRYIISNNELKVCNALINLQPPGCKIKLIGSSVVAYFFELPDLNKDIDMQITHYKLDNYSKMSLNLPALQFNYMKGSSLYTQFSFNTKNMRSIEATFIHDEKAYFNHPLDPIDISRVGLNVIKEKLGNFFGWDDNVYILHNAKRNGYFNIDLSVDLAKTRNLLLRILKYCHLMEGVLKPKFIFSEKNQLFLNEKWDNFYWLNWLDNYFQFFLTTRPDSYYNELTEILALPSLKNSKVDTVLFIACQALLDVEQRTSFVPDNMVFLLRLLYKNNSDSLQIFMSSMLETIQSDNKLITHPIKIEQLDELIEKMQSKIDFAKLEKMKKIEKTKKIDQTNNDETDKPVNIKMIFK